MQPVRQLMPLTHTYGITYGSTYGITATPPQALPMPSFHAMSRHHHRACEASIVTQALFTQDDQHCSQFRSSSRQGGAWGGRGVHPQAAAAGTPRIRQAVRSSALCPFK